MVVYTISAGILSTDAAPSLDCFAVGMLVYPDGCLTAGYPIRLGAVKAVIEVLTSALGADDEDPSDGCFSDAGRASLHVRLPDVAKLVPVCSYH